MNKNVLKTIAYLLVFCVFMVSVGKLLRYLVTDDVESYTRVTFHEMYEQDNIDVLFVGSSHCYRAFDTAILDERLHQNTFNAGTSSQRLDGSMLILKEASKYNDLKHVYVELYFVSAGDVKKNRDQMTNTYIIADYLKPSVDKYLYLLQASGSEHYANSFIVARRNWFKLFDFDYIKDLIDKKSDESYKEYHYDNLIYPAEHYAGKGYVADEIRINDWNYFVNGKLGRINVDGFSDDWLSDINRIMDYCEKKGIPLTFVVTPMSDYYLAGIGNYDEYIAYIKELIKNRNIDYYDFNLCKEEFFPSRSDFFMDTDHLNRYGAEEFSRSFAMLVNGEVSPEDMFYSSYNEKLDALPATVFGIAYSAVVESTEESSAIRNCRIISNKTDDLEYKIEIIPLDGNPYVLREYSGNTEFSIDSEEKGICEVHYRDASDPDREFMTEITIQ